MSPMAASPKQRAIHSLDPQLWRLSETRLPLSSRMSPLRSARFAAKPIWIRKQLATCCDWLKKPCRQGCRLIFASTLLPEETRYMRRAEQAAIHQKGSGWRASLAPARLSVQARFVRHSRTYRPAIHTKNGGDTVRQLYFWPLQRLVPCQSHTGPEIHFTNRSAIAML